MEGGYARFRKRKKPATNHYFFCFKYAAFAYIGNNSKIKTRLYLYVNRRKRMKRIISWASHCSLKRERGFSIIALNAVLMLFILFLPIPAAWAWVWPDTGQTKCYDNSVEIPCPAQGQPFYGQDAQYQGPTRSYTKLGQNGAFLPDTATQDSGWIMTRDNVTGLIWEIKTDDGGIHDKDNTYTWYDSNPATNGGYAGTPGDGTDTEDFIAALNDANYGGFSDWRMPTIKELSSLVNSSISYPGPTIDDAWFPYTVSSFYWSSTTTIDLTTEAWCMYFNMGRVYNYPKTWSHHVRAVRGGSSESAALTDNGDGTVTDTVTGLMWQKATAPGTYSWQSALSYCEDLPLAGYADWRLPNRNELQSLADYSRYHPAIDQLLVSSTESYFYWSSTTLAADPTLAYFVRFDNGLVDFYYKWYSFYVRAVRSIQSGGSISGTVTRDSGGAPVEGVSVSAYDYTTHECKGTDYNTDSSGSYIITDLPVGNYRVHVYTGDTYYVQEYYNNADYNNATAVTVIPGQTTSGINFSLALGGNISGVVTRDSDNQPVSGLYVHAYDYSTGNYLGFAQTQADGSYSTTGLPAGNYKVEVNTSGTYYVVEYYDNTDYNHATPVSVTSGATTHNIDFSLAIGGKISGVVTRDSDNQPVSGLYVHAYDYSTGNYLGFAQTQADGSYSTTGLPAGNYKVEVNTSGTDYIREYYNNTYNFSSATPVQVTAGQTTPGIDFELMKIEGDLRGDFNGDGNQDILWRNSQTGQVNVWLTNPASIGILSKGTLGTVADMNWEIQ
jgi:hypothetical protein